MNFKYYIELGIDYVINYAPKFLIALAILWVGLKVISTVTSGIDKMMEKRGLDATLRPFLHNLMSWTLKFALFILVAGQVGIDTMSFMAIFGAAGLAIGLALQGTLSNFASGVMLLIFRPFKVGDFIDAAGHMGAVEEIGIFVTALRSPQNRLIIIPNSAVGSSSVTNYSSADKVQARLAIGISYDANIKNAREVILGELAKDKRIMSNENVEVLVSELGDSSVNLSIRFWVDPNEYWPAFFENLENCKVALDAANIEIPFPQTVVHMKN
ncbi:MAG: small conductance mechanosensitive channel [Salibacteraceae bacterium]|jgi:small conductance mechanosensitive channel